MRWLGVLAILAVPHALRAEPVASTAPVAPVSTTPVAVVAPAGEPVDEPEPANGGMSTKRRAAAIGVAIVPGVFVHGAGSWVAHEKPAGKLLFKSELIGLGAMALGGLLVGATGGNPYTIVPGVPLVLGGTALFLNSWATDIWVASGGSRVQGAPRAEAPWFVEAGTTWQHDAYRDRALLRAGGRLGLGRTSIGALAMFDAGGDAKLGEADARVRVLRAASADDGSRLLARAGTRIHRDDDDEVTSIVGELEALGRYDLDRLDAAFGASFVEASFGVGALRTTYAKMEHELDSVLLGGFAIGAYLGARGEAKLFYDHRRDGLVGGLPAWRASGFVGSFGASADVLVTGPWAVRGELVVGNAWVTTLAVGYHGGAR